MKLPENLLTDLEISGSHGHCPRHLWICPTKKGKVQEILYVQIFFRIIVCPAKLHASMLDETLINAA